MTAISKMLVLFNHKKGSKYVTDIKARMVEIYKSDDMKLSNFEQKSVKLISPHLKRYSAKGLLSVIVLHRELVII